MGDDPSTGGRPNHPRVSRGASSRGGPAPRRPTHSSGRASGTRHQSNYRKRHFEKVCKSAGIPIRSKEEPEGKTPKALRDTFASYLLKAGVDTRRIKEYLGHSSIGATEKHYLKWLADEDDDPMTRAPGEVWPDLLSRLCASDSASDTQSGVA